MLFLFFFFQPQHRQHGRTTQPSSSRCTQQSCPWDMHKLFVFCPVNPSADQYIFSFWSRFVITTSQYSWTSICKLCLTLTFPPLNMLTLFNVTLAKRHTLAQWLTVLATPASYKLMKQQKRLRLTNVKNPLIARFDQCLLHTLQHTSGSGSEATTCG